MSLASDSILINAGGVGYELACSKNTLGDIVESEIASLFVHTHVREDCISLFGFSSKSEKQLFLSLIKVNGIGPKMASTILSGAALSSIISWINDGDTKSLTTLPKVGKKTAEQMILSLKGQLNKSDVGRSPSQRGVADQIKSADPGQIHAGLRPPERDLARESQSGQGHEVQQLPDHHQHTQGPLRRP